jgi:spermidine synthase
MWVALSMTASALLLAVTNQITQEVAPIPFLWVLPLTIYLLSFILTFSGERWYARPLFSVLLLVSGIGFIWMILNPIADFRWQIGFYAFWLFVTVMVCHGELYRLRPDPAHLTRFYLLVSVGGALGGVVVNLIAPLIFQSYWELHIFYALVFVLLALLTFMKPTRELPARWRFVHDVIIGATALALVIFTGYYMKGVFSDALMVERNFYGVIRVKENNGDKPGEQAYIMAHGATVHGFQFSAGDQRSWPTAYYTELGGAGLAILNHPKYGKGMRVGVLGLGIGTLAAYGQPGDDYRLYEINPVVVDLAEGQGGYFSYLKDSQAVVHTVLGDARISLERELNQSGSNQFDILVLDTFSSDSIPVHLVTREAFDIYLQHLAPDGILAAHITNQHLDLRPVFYQLAQAYGLKMVVIHNTTEGDGCTYPSTWVLLARSSASLDIPQIATRASDPGEYNHWSLRLWTDDYSNLFQILK